MQLTLDDLMLCMSGILLIWAACLLSVKDRKIARLEKDLQVMIDGSFYRKDLLPEDETQPQKRPYE